MNRSLSLSRSAAQRTGIAQSPEPEPFATRAERLYGCLAQVPEGYVVTYGQLAALAGLGRAARWTGQVLSQLPCDTKLPWHRVVGANGRISLPANTSSGALQRARLSAEGVMWVGQRVNLTQHRWHPQGRSE